MYSALDTLEVSTHPSQTLLTQPGSRSGSSREYRLAFSTQ